MALKTVTRSIVSHNLYCFFEGLKTMQFFTLINNIFSFVQPWLGGGGRVCLENLDEGDCTACILEP